MARLRVAEDGIDVLGFLPQDRFTEELLAAKVLVAPSLGGESFGIVLARALACATPVVASDIPGYRDVMEPGSSISFPAGDARALVAAVEQLLADEPRRQAMGLAGRRLAQERYSWDAIGRRLVEIYDSLVTRAA
jgi:glycosyltransferase involved in cell wall biosynthesis